MELHDGQEVCRDVEQQGGEHQGQAALDDIVAVRIKLVTAARTVGLFIQLERRLAHQQVTFVTRHQLIQG
ncbi:hypothetical protein D3C77_545780 [compost metagenome]